MRTANKWIRNYLIFALPIVIATVVWNSFQSDSEIRTSGSLIAKYLWETMSWCLIVWFAALFVFMVLLVFRKDTQESTIKHIAGIKERDEREQIIMGLAAKRSFVATTGLLMFLLFVSCFTVSVARLPDHSIDGKKSSLTLGFHFSGADKKETVSADGKIIYEHHDLPL